MASGWSVGLLGHDMDFNPDGTMIAIASASNAVHREPRLVLYDVRAAWVSRIEVCTQEVTDGDREGYTMQTSVNLTGSRAQYACDPYSGDPREPAIGLWEAPVIEQAG